MSRTSRHVTDIHKNPDRHRPDTGYQRPDQSDNTDNKASRDSIDITNMGRLEIEMLKQGVWCFGI
jgi:hypothetical protein